MYKIIQIELAELNIVFPIIEEIIESHIDFSVYETSGENNADKRN